MLWKDMISLLCNCTTSILKQKSPEFDLHELSSIVPGGDCPADNSLCFCRYSELSASPVQSANRLCLLLLLDTESVDSSVWASFCNVLAVREETQFQQCISLIRGYLQETFHLDRMQLRLLETISNNEALTAIINVVADMYDHYCDITDNSLQILAISENRRPPTAQLEQDHSTNYVSPEAVQYLRLSGNLGKMRESRLPFLVEDVPHDAFAYTVPIYVSATLIAGYLSIFVRQGECLSPAQLHYMPQTARLLSLELQKSRSHQLNKSTYFTHLLSALIGGTPSPEASYEERFMAFNYSLKRWKNMIVLRLTPELSSSRNIFTLSQALQSVFQNSVYMIHEEYLVYLISRDSPAVIPAEQLAVWEEYMENMGLHMGVSAVFEHTLDASVYLQQAKSALLLGKEQDPQLHLYHYDSYRIMDIVDKLSSRYDLRFFCYPPLTALINHTPDGETLTATLECYLRNHFSAAETCKELFLHRNTLYYRLEKIRNIMGCDYTLPENAAQITLTFTILKYRQIRDPRSR